MLLAKFEQHPLRSNFPPFAGFRTIESGSYYGRGYQDVQHRKPSIRNAKKLIDWVPTIDLDDSVGQTLEFFLQESIKSEEFLQSTSSKVPAPYDIVSMSQHNDKKPLKLKIHES